MNVRQAEDSCSHRANGRNEAKATKEERKEHKEFDGKNNGLNIPGALQIYWNT